MEGANSAVSPLKAAAGAAGAHATEAFELLGNETRMAILLALWEASDPIAEGSPEPTETNAVSFSALYDQVEYDTTANFSYHLEKLEDHFVRKTDEGYELLPAGEKIVRSVIASAGFEDASFAPAEIDLACPNCGAPTAVTYQNFRVYHVCTECEGNFALDETHPSGVLEGWISNPAVLRQREPEALYTARKTEAIHKYALRVAGICPECSGQIEPHLHVCDAHDPGADEACPACNRQTEVVVQFVCTVCKATSIASVLSLVLKLRPPDVAAFYREHGIEIGYNNLDVETASLLKTLQEEAVEELVSADPPRVRVTLRYEGDELQLTLDEKLNVIDCSD